MDKKNTDQKVNAHFDKVKQKKKIKSRVNLYFEKMREDIDKATTLYIEKMHPVEEVRVGEIFGKIQSHLVEMAAIGQKNPLTESDFEFLADIARRQLQEKHAAEASCMFRLIVHLNPAYSDAWVGWAISEAEQEHLEITEAIYEMALELLPHNTYIQLYAAEFFINFDKRRAKEILKAAQKFLKENSATNTDSYREVADLISLVA